MDYNPIVYNRYWTVECLRKLQLEISELKSVNMTLNECERFIEPSLNPIVKEILLEIDNLEGMLYATYYIMDRYMRDMESALNNISEKINEARYSGSKEFE